MCGSTKVDKLKYKSVFLNNLGFDFGYERSFVYK